MKFLSNHKLQIIRSWSLFWKSCIFDIWYCACTLQTKTGSVLLYVLRFRIQDHHYIKYSSKIVFYLFIPKKCSNDFLCPPETVVARNKTVLENVQLYRRYYASQDCVALVQNPVLRLVLNFWKVQRKHHQMNHTKTICTPLYLAVQREGQSEENQEKWKFPLLGQTLPPDFSMNIGQHSTAKIFVNL